MNTSAIGSLCGTIESARSMGFQHVLLLFYHFLPSTSAARAEHGVNCVLLAKKLAQAAASETRRYTERVTLQSFLRLLIRKKTSKEQLLESCRCVAGYAQ